MLDTGIRYIQCIPLYFSPIPKLKQLCRKGLLETGCHYVQFLVWQRRNLADVAIRYNSGAFLTRANCLWHEKELPRLDLKVEFTLVIQTWFLSQHERCQNNHFASMWLTENTSVLHILPIFSCLIEKCWTVSREMSFADIWEARNQYITRKKYCTGVTLILDNLWFDFRNYFRELICMHICTCIYMCVCIYTYR